MDRGHDGLCRAVGRPVRRDDAGRAPILDDDPRDRLGGQEGATVLFDDPRQRERQPDRPTLRQDPAEALAAGDQGKGERSAFWLIEWVQRHEGDPGEERADVLLLEAHGDDVQRARLPDSDTELTKGTSLRAGEHL